MRVKETAECEEETEPVVEESGRESNIGTTEWAAV